MIKLVLLPPNTTSKSQPCDQGIIQNLTLHYRKNLLMQMLTSTEAFEFYLLDAFYQLRLSWNSVLPSTVSGCFRHCGFVTQDESPTEDSEGSRGDSLVLGGVHNTDVSDARQLLEKVNNEVNIGD